ncbi:hypothetical protein SAMN04487969_102412 [Paenibacillus algorifonticola]|uniref:Uncharacterized protein n=1 Tax=Paenibacillus algorifonticola TaxID=684063 RepID=A0A1I2ACD7_9BACL|nr:DUF5682 family protein [Paenibacillus algorifonticola]SFE41556.1 hypothetical protein SAMN04487969_102412 [Paenibacillus algorifonticola]
MNVNAEDQVFIFGVRHLSPGGAKHLLEYLNEVQPTAVLIEGPSDATGEIQHLTHAATTLPAAILAFTEELPVRTVLWPFAVYSPEFQAMKWAKEHGAAAAFIDLPSSVTLALQDALRSKEKEPSAIPEGEERRSIYSRIAELAGESDYDMYWERSFEQNANPGAYREAILAFSAEMRTLGEAKEQRERPAEHAYNTLRESYMRRQIQKTIAAGHHPQRIVVVCGAYHAAALADLTEAMSDEEAAGLPSRSTKHTLMPYSYYKLSTMSGYGAGNDAPHYFQMMWEAMESGVLEQLPHRYLASVARLVRSGGTHRSTAEVIEAVRMAESLAALHDGSAPTLRDLHDAAQTLLGHGELSAVAEALARVDVGTAIGSLAEGVSQTPIQDDLNRQLKRLKLEKYKTTVASTLTLDLRENRRVASAEAAFLDLNRSILFHRLLLLGISFVKSQPSGQEGATWAENWLIQWSPEAEIQVVEATLLGETIEVACAYMLREKLLTCRSIEEASALIHVACCCGMTSQMEEGSRVLQKLAADSRDVVKIAAAARELSMIIGYGDIRKVDTEPLIPLLVQLFHRGSLYLLDGSGCNDEAAGGMITAINELNRISQDHSEIIDDQLWVQELLNLSERDDRNPKLSGFACAILMERGAITAEQCAAEVSRRLSPGITADLGAGWFEGLSMRNRYSLLSRTSLWEQLNHYINSLQDDEFKRALVFLRRAFSSFSSREKTMIGELLGELWGVSGEQAAEIITGELMEEEIKMLDDLNDFDFEDL